MSAAKKYKLSVLGDSISSYGGVTNNPEINKNLEKNLSYYSSPMDKSDLTDVADTYWMQTANALGLEICVPNGCGASRVTDTVRESYPDAVIPRGMERADSLHRDDGTYPDIIFIYLGINDIGNGISPELYEREYDALISKITSDYKDAKIYVGTLTAQNRKATEELNEIYNGKIKSVAKKYSARVVDFARDSQITFENYRDYTVDGLHPNKEGMKKLAQCLITALKSDLSL